MYSTYPLMYNADISMAELGMMPSSIQEWKNVKDFQRNRGLMDPPNMTPQSLASGTATTYTSYNGGVANLSDVLGGRVSNPKKYEKLTNLQAYIQLAREADREPTEQELIDASTDDYGIDARFIALINDEGARRNYNADQAQNFKRTLQKSVNNYYLEDALYKVPLDLENISPSILQAFQAGRKRGGVVQGVKEARKPFNEFKKDLTKGLKEGKKGADFVQSLATKYGFGDVADIASTISTLLGQGITVANIASSFVNANSIVQLLGALNSIS